MFKGHCIYTVTYIKHIETCQNMFASTVNVNKYPIYAKAFLNLHKEKKTACRSKQIKKYRNSIKYSFTIAVL